MTATQPIKVYVIDYGKARKYLVLQWIDPTTGKRRSKSAKTSKRREAGLAAAELEKALNAAMPTGDGRLPFGDFVLLYDQAHLTSLAPASRYRSLSVLSIFRETIAPETVGQITSASVLRFVAAIRAHGSPKKTAGKGKGVSETTIRGYLATLRAALAWAKDAGHLAEVPTMPKVARATKSRAKGRPLTNAEFVAMLRAVRGVVGRKAARSWRRLLIGLWLSGLRLAEALELSWDEHARIVIDTKLAQYPILRIDAAAEKGFSNRILPLTPDFVRWILRTPVDRRSGPVFPLEKARWRDVLHSDHVSKVITKIGRASGVKVSATKHASAHDLRRSFGLRWSQKVMPNELKLMMRHSDINTTLNFYAILEMSSLAAKLWGNGTQQDAQH